MKLLNRLGMSDIYAPNRRLSTKIIVKRKGNKISPEQVKSGDVVYFKEH